ncbi:MAG: GAF domain-containing protein [Acidobacteriota bacterium]
MTVLPDALRSLSNDPARLADIAELGLPSASEDPELAELLARVSRRHDMSIVIVSLVLGGAQHWIAQHGLSGWMAEAGGTPVEWSFCTQVVATGQPVVVEDATADSRVAGNPLIEEEGVRCYAGVPLVTSRGHVLGSLCVIGSTRSSISSVQITALEEAAALIMERLEARRRSR